MLTKKGSKGFTLIELLVVISIISLLSSVILASLNNARERARATRIVQDLKEIEKALVYLADDQNMGSTWWPESGGNRIPGNTGNVANPTIATLIANGPLGNFMPAAPVPPVGTGYNYDHDSDDFVVGACGVVNPTLGYGVNIFMPTMGGAANFNIIDQIIDGGDGANCGRVLTDGNLLLYKVSPDGAFR